ncbi:MAG: hypothetical protein C0610_16805 [Desulfobacteraceae bacterium]|nr:MAG: hypothetical protein C0610_16805 [Desulfobacteraceae bacterium]
MCTAEDIRQINQHTDVVGDALHNDHEGTVERILRLEQKFEGQVDDIRQDFKDDLRLVFEHLTDIRATLGAGLVKTGGIICTLILTVFGFLFNFLWEEEKAHDQRLMTNAAVISTTVAKQENISDDVAEIAEMIRQEIDRQRKENGMELDRHLKYEHRDKD